MNITDNLKKKKWIKKYEIFPLSVKELKDIYNNQNKSRIQYFVSR
jgi:hypothetical protein